MAAWKVYVEGCRQERQMLEHVGVQMDFGCTELSRVPHRFAADPQVLASFQAFQEACQMSLTRAFARANGERERRFAPAESLQSEGKLGREKILEFTSAAVTMLTSEESQALLGKADGPQEAGALSVTWQRELLEHLGVEMNFGCAQLGLASKRFENDAKVMKAMYTFQTTCQTSIQQALLARAQAEARQALAADHAVNGLEALELA